MDQTQLLGAVAVLFAGSEAHREFSVRDFYRAVAPPISLNQYVVLVEDGFLVGWASWANLTEEAENRLLNSVLLPEDWNAGDRTWVIDGIAPGRGFKLARALRAVLRGHVKWIRRNKGCRIGFIGRLIW